jgi:diadenosine tetraphosphate (Ap4A) HIT family hydrolase
MPETPEQIYERAASALRMPAVEEWETFPFDGDMRPRRLQPPVQHEPARHGEGGIDCASCSTPDTGYLWTNERWRLRPTKNPNGLPLILLLETRDHLAEPGDLPDELASELGVLLARIDRAIRSIGDVGRVHIGRWGDGSEHLHWWFLARPARLMQLLGSFAAIWDDILPPTPEEVWKENLAAAIRALSSEMSLGNRDTDA